MLPLTIPQEGTAVRPAWSDLPAEARAIIEDQCGATVERAESMDAGFTPGFASRLSLSDGRRVFVKAADDATRSLFADSYREEIQKLAVLPAAVPATRLLWSHDGDGWVVLGFEDIQGGHPERPWRSDQLELVLAALDATAAALTPAPSGQTWPRLAEYVGQQHWARLAGDANLPDWLRPRLDECDRLAAVGTEALDGDTLVHGDIRDDNILIDAQARVWICDWNWCSVGNPALDSLIVLASAQGDGHEADAWLPRSETTRALDSDAIDGILALVAAFFWKTCQPPAPATSPWLRIHQRWYADATTGWLAQRRRWR